LKTLYLIKEKYLLIPNEPIHDH